MRFKLVETLEDLCQLDNYSSVIFRDCYGTDNPYDLKNLLTSGKFDCLRIAYDGEKELYLISSAYDAIHPQLVIQAILNGYYIDEQVFPKDVLDLDYMTLTDEAQKVVNRMSFSMFFKDVNYGIEEMCNDNDYEKFLIYDFGVVGYQLGIGENIEQSDLIKILGNPKEIRLVQ